MSTFYLALEQIDLIDSQKYIEEAIFLEKPFIEQRKRPTCLHYLLGECIFKKTATRHHVFMPTFDYHLKKKKN